MGSVAWCTAPDDVLGVVVTVAEDVSVAVDADVAGVVSVVGTSDVAVVVLQ